MAEERQPSTIKEGASNPHAPTSTAEDRKAAAALSSLDAQDDEAGKKDVDSRALGEAMKNLSVGGEGAADKKKAVKVDTANVTLLISELEVPKSKAIDMLRAHNGDAVNAMTAFAKAVT